MLEKTNAYDVYFEDQIQILVHDPELFAVDAAEAVLTSKKIEFSTIDKNTTL